MKKKEGNHKKWKENYDIPLKIVNLQFVRMVDRLYFV